MPSDATATPQPDASAAAEDAELMKLLEEQAAFLKSGKPAAAKVLRGAPPRIVPRRVPPSSTGHASVQAERQAVQDDGGADLPVLNPDVVLPRPKKTPIGKAAPKSSTSGGIAGMAAAPEDYQRAEAAVAAAGLPPVLTEISEREPSVGVIAPLAPRATPSRLAPRGGFPRAAHRSTLSAEEKERLRCNSSASTSSSSAAASTPGLADGGGAGGPKRGAQALGASVASAIHTENSTRLSKMSADEIAKAQRELMANLDPALVKKLRERQQQRQTGGGGSGGSSSQEAPQRKAAVIKPPIAASEDEDEEDEEGVDDRDDLDTEAAEAAELERLKQEWMDEAPEEPPPPPDAGDGNRTASEAIEAATRKLGMHDVRFDLAGVQIDAATAASIDVKQGLHHHGENPSAPGYTLAELSHLTRSTVAAQRSQALVALAGVLRHSARGTAGAEAGIVALSTSLATVRWCRDADTALILRVSLDDAHLSCVHSALEACDALAEAMGGSSKAGAPLPLGHIVTECARSYGGGWRGCEGFYPPAASAGTDDGGGGGKGESDADLCRRDLLEGWIRMGIAGRLRYLLDSGGLTPAGTAAALSLLCRCAYRSPKLSYEIARTPHLFESLRLVLEETKADGGEAVARALLLLQLLVQASRELAAKVMESGVLLACNGVLAHGFRFASSGGAKKSGSEADEEEEASRGGARLAAMVLGLWRCLAAYALSEPPLGDIYPLLSQATRRKGGSLGGAAFGLLETLCTLGGQVVGALDWNEQGVGAAASGEAEEEEKEKEEVAVPLEDSAAGGGGRWRLLAAYVPAALEALAGGSGSTGASSGDALRVAGAGNFLASYVAASMRLQGSLEGELALVPWCESVAARLQKARLAGGGGGGGGVESALCVLEGAGTEDDQAEAAAADARITALEALVGYTRLLWQLSRANRGLLSAWREEEGGGVVGLLRRAANVLAGAATAIGPLERVPAGRLAYFVALLLDGIGSTRPFGGGTGGGTGGGGAGGGGGGLLLAAAALSGASWLRKGDEARCSELLSIAFSSRVLTEVVQSSSSGSSGSDAQDSTTLESLRALLPVFLQTVGRGGGAGAKRGGEAEGRPAVLRREVGSGGALLLTRDWLTAPLYRFEEGMDAQRMAQQVGAGLRLLRTAVSQRAGAAAAGGPTPTVSAFGMAGVAPGRLLCRGLAVFALPGGLWREVREEMAAWLEVLVDDRALGEGLLSEERGVDVAALIEEVMTVYSAESYGDDVFTRWVLLGLRVKEAPSVQQAVWAALEVLSAKLEVQPPKRASLGMWLGAAHDAAGAGGATSWRHPLLDAWEASVLKGSLKEASEASFLKRLALYWLAMGAKHDRGLEERLATGGGAALVDAMERAAEVDGVVV